MAAKQAIKSRGNYPSPPLKKFRKTTAAGHKTSDEKSHQTVVSLGWGDIPAVVQDGFFPSTKQDIQEWDKDFSEGFSALPVHKRKQHPGEEEDVITSFGWHDFPLVGREHAAPSSIVAFPVSGPVYDEPPHVIESGDSEEEEETALFVLNMRKELSGEEEAVVTSFGWHNFPLVGREHATPSSLSSTATEDPCSIADFPLSGPLCDESPHIIETIETSDLEEDETDVLVVNNQLISRQKSRSGRRVRFSSVLVREYAITLGVHPLADAYPVSLDWAHTDTQIIDIDDYERLRKEQKDDRDGDKKVPRPDYMERRARLAQVTGQTTEELDAEERHRQRLKEAQEVLEEINISL